MSRPLLIINAVAGQHESNMNTLRAIQSYLARGELAPELAYITPELSARQLTRNAIADGRELILVGGGDGTVSEVAAELVGKPLTLGILPIGTFNNIARSVGILADVAGACSVVNEGYVREIDIGVANDEHYFFEAAGVGLDAALFPIGEEIKSGRWGRVIEAARLTLGYRRPTVRITFAETLAEVLPDEQKAGITVVANGPYYGSGFTVAPNARLTDGRLTVTIYKKFSKFELVSHFWSISRGRYAYSPKVETFHTREVHIQSLHALSVHLDDKLLGYTPVKLSALSRALQVLVPRKTEEPKDREATVALPAVPKTT